jgi:hypothetical protein
MTENENEENRVTGEWMARSVGDSATSWTTSGDDAKEPYVVGVVCPEPAAAPSVAKGLSGPT